ncbi:hypothetical protein PMAYCL1PPCAC_17932, partial [Pristionchus mayeri]
LALLHEASMGKTKEELSRVLTGRVVPSSSVSSYYSSLLTSISEKNCALTMLIANRIFLHKECVLKQEYLDNIGRL